MDRTVRPVRRPDHMAMLHGIDVHVIHVSPQVTLVGHQALPESALPDSTLARRDLIEKALEVLLEESKQSFTIRYPLAKGDVLTIDVRRERPTPAGFPNPFPIPQSQ